MKPRFIPTSVHAAVDHVVGPALVAAPTVLGLGRKSPEGILAEAVGGMKNLVPMKAHLALDAVGGATLALVPQLTGARQKGKNYWLPHLAIDVLEIGMAALTKTEPPRRRTAAARSSGSLWRHRRT